MRYLLLGLFLAPIFCQAEVALPQVAVKVSDGKTYQGNLDPKTNADGLWLRFGASTTVIRRRFDWHSVHEITADAKSLSPQAAMNLAAAAQPPTIPAANRFLIASSELPLSAPQQVARPRVVDVIFDVTLGNWDQDVEADGLLVHATPIDGDGLPVDAAGIMNVELFANYRVDQDAVPHGRGSEVRTVGQWSIRLDGSAGEGREKWMRLPFQASIPEFDNRWAPVGLVHFQFVAPGEGTFYRSIDGVRIRPWAPFRDGLERKSRQRFLPTEWQ